MKINCLTDSKIKTFKPEKKSDGTFKKATFRDGDGLVCHYVAYAAGKGCKTLIVSRLDFIYGNGKNLRL